MANPLEIKGRKVVAQGILNTGDMTIEMEGFEMPVSIADIIEQLNGQYVKITVNESDRVLTQSDLEN